VREVEITIEEIGARGDGVAHHGGARLYVPYTAPGDVAEIELCGDRGKVLRLKTESPHRAAPSCPHYGRCGGCALQHVAPDYYLEWKCRLITYALARAGVEAGQIAPVFACPPPSRRRVTFCVSNNKNGASLGFNARRSDKMEAIDHCGVLHPGLASKIEPLRRLAAAAPMSSFDLAVTLCDNGLDINIIDDDCDFLSAPEISAFVEKMHDAATLRLSLNGEPVIEFEKPVIAFGAIAVTPPPGGFLQASREGEAALTDLVMQHMAGAKYIADLSSSAGTFTFPLSSIAMVDAFDADKAAIAALDSAARDARLAHPVKAIAQNLFERPVMAAELNQYDGVVFDPPRSGARLQAGEIAGSSVGAVVGVSCNPVSFARDAAILRDGGYTLVQVTPVDQFVYAPHVELVGIFQKR